MSSSISESVSSGRIEIAVLDSSGSQCSSLLVKSSCFDVQAPSGVLHSTIVWQSRKARAGTHSSLNKSMIRGGSRKPFKQKGTGRARAGDFNSPHWVGGAVAHGPKPRSYETRLGKRVKATALASVLSEARRSGSLIVVDSLTTPLPKTKSGMEVLSALNVSGKKVVLIDNCKNASRSFLPYRNLAGVRCLPTAGVNAYSLLNCEIIVMSKGACEEIQERFGSD
jgi:large subunit ribosomal protein L4